MRVRTGLLLALLTPLLAAGCGSSNNSPSTPTSPSGGGAASPVSIVSGASNLTTTAYAPNPINVAVGATVTWTNNDTTAHTATANDGTWNSGTMAPGASFSRTFPSAGTFTYFCTIHPGMVGSVMVQ